MSTPIGRPRTVVVVDDHAMFRTGVKAELAAQPDRVEVLGEAADADEAVTVKAGALEASNVNAVSAMVDMINLARNFEMQMKLLQNADGNEQRANQLLSAGG